MAAPTAAAPTVTTFATAATAHLVNMPATVVQYTTLLMGCSVDGTSTVTTPTGWAIQCVRTTNGSMYGIVFIKVADGTEGGTTVGVTTSVNASMCAHVYNVVGWGGTLATDVVSGTPATGSSTAPDPPSASWSWGSLDALAIEFSMNNGSSYSVSSYSTNYTGGTNSREATAGSAIGSAQRALTAAASPEDPDAWSISASQTWVTNTVVFKQTGPFPSSSYGRPEGFPGQRLMNQILVH